MNFDNLFDFCNENTTSLNNSIYYVGDYMGNTLLTLSIDNVTNQVYSYSNEWLYLIRCYYPDSHHPMYYSVPHVRNEIVNNKQLNTTFCNENVLSLITSFSTGTVHGYTGFYNTLIEYFKNYEHYKDFKLLVYKNSQQGMIDIVYHLIHKNILDGNKVIFIDRYVQYLFNRITFIPNRFHVFSLNNGENLGYELSPYLERWVINDKNDTNYFNSLNLPNNDRICIIKSSTSPNLTSSGVVNIHDVLFLCGIINFAFVEPGTMNEVNLIHILNKSKILILSWGTVFMKNYIYISDHCEKIFVFVIGSDFITQYHCAINSNTLVTRFKNSKIIYHIVSENLDNVDLSRE